MDNSKIFFTIWRNKYLNTLIFDNIYLINRYNKSLLNDQDLSISYVRQYQYINNVRWMINYGHLGLLKDKIKRNEFLILDSETCCYSIVSKVQDYETFELLFQRYRDEFRNYTESLITIAIKHGNLAAIQILLKDPEYLNDEKIKMIDLAITSGKVKTLEFIINYLKDKQDNREQREGTQYGNNTKIDKNKKPIIELNFTRSQLIKNIFSCPMFSLPSMVDYIFDSNNETISILNIDIKEINKNNNFNAKFSDIFSLLQFKYLKFFLENKIVSFDPDQFINSFNLFTPFTNEITVSSFLDYIRKFVYVFINYFKKSSIEFMESLELTLTQIEKYAILLSNSDNSSELLNQMLQSVEELNLKLSNKKKESKNTIEKQSDNPWEKPRNNYLLTRSSYYTSSPSSSISEPKTSKNPINNENEKEKEKDIENSFVVFISENYGSELLTLEKRVLNKIINLYIYKIFYPLNEFYQSSKLDITINKFAIFRKDISIINDSKLYFPQFTTDLKYITFSELFAVSLEYGDVSFLHDFNKIYSKTGNNYIHEYAKIFTLPFEFRIFRYCQSDDNDLKKQKDYLTQMVRYLKSFLKKFHFSNVFCWLSNVPEWKQSNKLMNHLRDLLLIHPHDINQDQIDNQNNSVAFKAVLNNCYPLVEYCVINRDFFEIKENVFTKAIVHCKYEMVQLFINSGIAFPNLCVLNSLKTKNYKILKMVVEGGAKVTLDSIKEAANDHMVEEFRLLIKHLPYSKLDDPIFNYLTNFSILDYVICSNKIFLSILENEFKNYLEDNVYGDNNILIDQQIKINQHKFKLNTTQLLRQEKFESIYKHIQDVCQDNELFKKAFNSIIFESLENYQFDCFYKLIDIFNGLHFFNDFLDSKFKLIQYLMKNNHFNIILYCINQLSIKITPDEFIRLIDSIDLDVDYISTQVFKLIFDWLRIGDSDKTIDYYNNITISNYNNNNTDPYEFFKYEIRSSIFLLYASSIKNNRFALFKFLHQSFFQHKINTLSTQLNGFIINSSNSQFLIYLSTFNKDDNHSLIDEYFINYNEEIKEKAIKKKPLTFQTLNNDYADLILQGDESPPLNSNFNEPPFQKHVKKSFFNKIKSLFKFKKN